MIRPQRPQKVSSIYERLNKTQLFGRRFDAGGAPLGDEFAVTSSESRIGSYAVAMAPDGRFVVLIERLSQLSAGLGVVAMGSSTFTVQRYDADGSQHGLPIFAGGRPALEISVPLGVPSSLPSFLILGTNARAPAVAMDTAGDFVLPDDGVCAAVQRELSTPAFRDVAERWSSPRRSIARPPPPEVLDPDVCTGHLIADWLKNRKPRQASRPMTTSR